MVAACGLHVRARVAPGAAGATVVWSPLCVGDTLWVYLRFAHGATRMCVTG